MLLAGLIGLQSVVWGLGLHFRKGAVPPARPLYLIGERIGPWRLVDRATLGHAVVDELGTERYVSRTYRRRGEAFGAGGLRSGAGERGRGGEPGSAGGEAVRVHVAYYTGLADAVPHVQRRFYLVGGASGETIDRRAVRLSSPYLAGEAGEPGGGVVAVDESGGTVRLPGRVVPIELSRVSGVGGSGSGRVLASFYVVNGRYAAEAGAVRRRMADPTLAAGYWCRVELAAGRMRGGRFRASGDPDLVARVAGRFLSDAMPEIMRCLPQEPE